MIADLFKADVRTKLYADKARAVKLPNPFLPRLNPVSGRWAPPKYSLRRQADLVKAARKSGWLHLLPPGPKLSVKELEAAVPTPEKIKTIKEQLDGEYLGRWATNLWAAPRVWEGKPKEKKVAGEEVGNKLYAGKWRMFKGHKWERTREKRIKRREILMKGMQQRIERFKSVRCSSCLIAFAVD